MPSMKLEAGMQLVLEAIDPTTGAAVTGVTATHWAIYGEASAEGSADVVSVGPFMLVPGPESVG